MKHKSRELDKWLSDIISPLGFRRVPKTRHFIRLCGDGVFQGFYWYYEPRYSSQALQGWIESVWSHPEWLFRRYLTYRDAYFMSCGVSCADYEYRHDEYIPVRIFSNPSEDTQKALFLESVLPRFERWKTQACIFSVHQGAERASAEGYPLFQPRYWSDRDLNIALYLNKEDAQKYIDGPLTHEKKRCREWIESGKTLRPYDLHRLEIYENRKTSLTSPSAVQEYLEQCRAQNLQDYDVILLGGRGQKKLVLDEWTP